MDREQDASGWRARALSTVGYVGVWQADYTTAKVRGDGDLGRVLGVAPEKLVDGVPLDQLDHLYVGDDLEVVKRSRRAIVAAGGHVRYEFRMRHLEQEGCRWIRSLAQMDVDRDGRVRQVSGALFDLTARTPPRVANVLLPTEEDDPAREARRPLPLQALDQLSGQLIHASRSARALGLVTVEAELRLTLSRVGGMLSRRLRTTISH